mgnify:CR=1 FL=1
MTKGVRVGRHRVDIMADFYNAFNVAPVLTYTTTYGPATWLMPQTYPAVRAIVKLGGDSRSSTSVCVYHRGGNKMMRTHVPVGWIIAAALFPATVFAQTVEADIREGHCADLVRQVRHVPPAWRGGADVAACRMTKCGRGLARSRTRSSPARCHRGTPRGSTANGVTIAA